MTEHDGRACPGRFFWSRQLPEIEHIVARFGDHVVLSRRSPKQVPSVSQVETEDDLPLLLLDDEVQEQQPSWKLLIVDDEPAIHTVTRMVLNGLRLGGRCLSFLSAFDGPHARALLDEHPDIALILLDVVMETDDAGLRLVRHIREKLGNSQIRIILRTGQPGQAPEQQVVLEYDINDYKEKTELTAQKLTTAVIASLRAYQALVDIAALNRELEAKVNERTCELQSANARLMRSLAALEQGERAGRRVQFKMLPQQHWQRGPYRFSHLLLPSEFMSGDFVDYFQIDAERIGFYIADVSGHGVASAFVTVYLKRFLSTALEAFRHGQVSAITDPAQMLAQLNHELLREKIGKHIAICYAVLDLRDNRLGYANAGAFPYPLLATPDQTRFLEAPSRPAGLFERSPFTNQMLELPERFRLLLCSDGVLEVLPPGSTETRLGLLESSLDPALASLESVCERLQIQTSGQLPDDLTMLLLACDVRS